jgi:hypothetical protein
MSSLFHSAWIRICGSTVLNYRSTDPRVRHINYRYESGSYLAIFVLKKKMCQIGSKSLYVSKISLNFRRITVLTLRSKDPNISYKSDPDPWIRNSELRIWFQIKEADEIPSRSTESGSEHCSPVMSTSSVADPDPGSGAFLTPGSGIRNRIFPVPGSRIPDPKPIYLRAY